MENNTGKTKEQRITSELTKLRRIYKKLDANIYKTVEPLLENAAFMAVSLDELQNIINSEGYTDEYRNGEHQYGKKQSDAVKTHLAMTKNHASIIKQLTELCPPAERKQSRLQAMREG